MDRKNWHKTQNCWAIHWLRSDLCPDQWLWRDLKGTTKKGVNNSNRFFDSKFKYDHNSMMILRGQQSTHYFIWWWSLSMVFWRLGWISRTNSSVSIDCRTNLNKPGQNSKAASCKICYCTFFLCNSVVMPPQCEVNKSISYCSLQLSTHFSHIGLANNRSSVDYIDGWLTPSQLVEYF